MGIDLDHAYAYSDSLNDLPLLSAVGTPIVVNPNKELLRIARKMTGKRSSLIRNFRNRLNRGQYSR